MLEDDPGPRRVEATLDDVLAEVRDLRALIDPVPAFQRSLLMALHDLTRHVERLCILIEGGVQGQRRP